jgi:radical SAM family uncharacterized protein/radical SAM-linked protein
MLHPESRNSLVERLESILPHVARPGRYAGGEVNAIRKDWNSVEVRFALAFPDAYEIGMSNLGLEMLYHILNAHEWIAAERVYSPWMDMEKAMRENRIPLFSLESKQPIGDFDVLGISYQYELQVTNLLTLLDLAGLPLESAERNETHPLVVIGGPCAFNPEPLADFVDAVALGDGETLAVDIAEAVRTGKREKWSRKTMLERLARIPGVYVPSLYRIKEDADGRFLGLEPIGDAPVKIQARVTPELLPEHYSDRPLVPLIEITHNRCALEIMRGCGRGCRFCNAGMVYRPVRQRPAKDVIRQAVAAVEATGRDEVSLLSLSTSDYRGLTELLTGLRQCLPERDVAISFPSLRSETFTSEMADLARGLRHTGLTLAPEAGTARLRAVINKTNSEENLYSAIKIAFERDWPHVKLYFMIGLPTETDEDLNGIVRIVGETVHLARRYGKKTITVSLSPFSPKPHTPFQWEAQDPVETLNRKMRYLKDNMHWRGVELGWRDGRTARLETILGRGDRKLGKVIRTAWENGARFDGWSEQWNPDIWDEAIRSAGVDAEEYLRARHVDEPQPWSHLSKGVSEAFLRGERQKALAESTTPDCREACAGCGLNCGPKSAALDTDEKTDCSPAEKTPDSDATLTVRVGYSKGRPVRFTSHLDVMRILMQSARRAGIRFSMTLGHHARPKIAAGPPLPLGYTSVAEYIDLTVENTEGPDDIREKLNRTLPEGFECFACAVISGKPASLSASINAADYRIDFKESVSQEAFAEAVSRFHSGSAIPCRIKDRESMLAEWVQKIDLDEGLKIRLKIGPNGSIRVEEAVRALLALPSAPDMRIQRTGLFIDRRLRAIDRRLRAIENNNDILTPLEEIQRV